MPSYERKAISWGDGTDPNAAVYRIPDPVLVHPWHLAPPGAYLVITPAGTELRAPKEA